METEAIRLANEVTSALEDALKSGGKLHAFRSGGGLRVVNISTPRKDIGYGEHPYINEALTQAAEDFRAGGRTYQEMYGKLDWDNPKKSVKGIYTHYLTGSSTPNSDLDAWILRGNTFDATYADNQFVFELVGYEHYKAPDGALERATAGELAFWTDNRGVRFMAGPSKFPSGELTCFIKALSLPDGMSQHNVYSWMAVRRGKGTTLMEAIKSAFLAEPVEITKAQNKKGQNGK